MSMHTEKRCYKRSTIDDDGDGDGGGGDCDREAGGKKMHSLVKRRQQIQ